MNRFKTLVSILILFYSLLAESAVILQYHHISDSTPPSTSLSPQLFAQHLNFLEDNQYSIWSLPKLKKYLNEGRKIPDKVVAITFDDGYQSIYENAFPLLKERNWPFTVFVSTESVHDKSEIFMSWSQLKKLSENGATIANHSLSHSHLIRKAKGDSFAQWHSRVQNEIMAAEIAIKTNIGHSSKLFAYPFGEYTETLEQLVGSLGLTAFGQQSGAIGKHQPLTSLPRFPMTNAFGEISQFTTKVASLPLPNVTITPSSHLVLDPNHFANGVTIRFPFVPIKLEHLACYLSGFGKVNLQKKITSKEFHITIRSPLSLPAGRSRLNCTAPSSDQRYQGRYYWFSHSWMKKQKDGSWYPET